MATTEYDAPPMADHSSDMNRLLGPDRRFQPRRIRLLEWMVIGVVVLVGAGLVWLWPGELPELETAELGLADDAYRARVLESTELPCEFAPDLNCVDHVFELEEGPDEGSTVVLSWDVETAPALTLDDVVLLYRIDTDDGSLNYQFADRVRGGVLLVAALLFAAAVVALGRMRGLAALTGLVISVGLLLGFIIPAIVTGRDPVLVAAVGGAAIALVAIYLAHGVNDKSHVAVLGAFAALALTAALSAIGFGLAQFTGLVSDETFFILAIPGLDPTGLLLAGAVLGAIGALDDVTVSQASTVWEVARANPRLDPRALYAAGIRVGRDHIASTVNTLLLAYAGAALPLLLLFTLSQQSLGLVANSEVVAVEIMRTLVGSVGLVAAVPITTLMASRLAPR